MNVEAVNFRYELWELIQTRFDLAPVVGGTPVCREALHHRKLHALG